MTLTSHRIKYLDLLKVFAIFMMVQGHTIDTFLHTDLRSSQNLIYNIWIFLRGYTAPIFFFSSGVLLSFLLNKENDQKKQLYRIKKGFLRALGLLIIGYLLRFPSHKIFDFSHVTLKGWKIFFTVDALHLISVGVFLILVIHYVAIKYKFHPKWILFVFLALVVLFSPIINSYKWNDVLTYPLTGYFYFETGSYFPLFPYLSYLIFGAFIGTTINGKTYKNGGYITSITGIFLILMIFISDSIIPYQTLKLLHNLGIIIILSHIFELIGKTEGKKSSLFRSIADRSLMIYIVHLIILYGCAWFPGFYNMVGQKFNLQITLLFVLIMIILMFSLVIFTDRIFKNKRHFNSLAK